MFSKKGLITVGLILVVMFFVAAGVKIGWDRHQMMKVKSTSEFSGDVREVGDNYITVEGKYSTDLSDSAAALTTVKIQVDSGTQISRKAFTIPSAEELAKSGGVFYPEKLPKTESMVGLDKVASDFKIRSLGVTVESSGNIYGKGEFTASSISYILPNE